MFQLTTFLLTAHLVPPPDFWNSVVVNLFLPRSRLIRQITQGFFRIHFTREITAKIDFNSDFPNKVYS